MARGQPFGGKSAPPGCPTPEARPKRLPSRRRSRTIHVSPLRPATDTRTSEDRMPDEELLLLPQVPVTRTDDPEDVSWALSTAEAMWARGEHAEGLKWIRKA